MTAPAQRISVRTDPFGRTEDQILTAIAHAEKLYEISSAYRGGEGLALELDRKRRDIEVDRRWLARLRGELRDELPTLSGAALEKFRKTILALGDAGKTPYRWRK